MSLARYPEYKDSGVDWLGQVPRHWSVKRLRNLGKFSASGIDKKSVEDELPVKMLNYVDVYNSKSKVLNFSSDLMDTTAPLEKVVEHSVQRGDILITPSSETAEDIGHAARIADMPANVVYSYHVLRYRPSGSVSAEFSTYAMNSIPMRAYFSSVCTGTTRMVLSREDFKGAWMAFPGYDEQTAIATFLDRETGKIDALISEQEKLLVLLAEKRQATISQAVTKGLNPDAPMKDSGMAWLGDVPEHWLVVPAKRVASVFVPQRNKPELNEDGEGTYWATMEDIKTNRLFSTKLWVTDTAIKEAGSKKLSSGAVIASCVGNFGVASINDVEVVINQQLQAYIPDSVIAAEYLRYVVTISGSYYEQTGTAATLVYVNQQGFENLPTPVPPTEEQTAIIEFLQSEVTKLEALSANAIKAIALLKERRSALIAAAVTGQVNVCGLVTEEAA